MLTQGKLHLCEDFIHLLNEQGDAVAVLTFRGNADGHQEDAARLVLAWNAHDDLVAALQEIVALADNLLSGEKGTNAGSMRAAAASMFRDAAREAIRRDRESIRQKRLQAEDDHKARLAEFDNILAAVRARRKHPETKYYSDPAGGRDNSTVCEDCGKEV
jgi:hypothetical protein